MKDVSVLSVLKKDAKARQKKPESRAPNREPAHKFFVSQNWKSLVERRPDIAPKAKESLPTKAIGISDKVVALDCEMVGVGSNGKRSALARVSIVDSEGKTLLDRFVKPLEYVTDFRTEITGITPGTLKRKEILSEDIAREMTAKILDGKIVVGHSLQNDFQALLLSHPHVLIRDTSLFRPLRPPELKTRTPSLKKLAEYWLHETIQEGTHDSILDAKAALRLYMLKSKEWEKQMRSAMQHPSQGCDEEEDDGEQVEREAPIPKKKTKKKKQAKSSSQQGSVPEHNPPKAAKRKAEESRAKPKKKRKRQQ